MVDLRKVLTTDFGKSVDGRLGKVLMVDLGKVLTTD
jgi:hypothetical protein